MSSAVPPNATRNTNSFVPLLFIGLLACLAIAVFRHAQISIHGMQHLLGELSEAKEKHPVGFFIGFFLCYVAVTALCIPLEVPFALTAGALYGLALGIPFASFAAAIGATLAFSVARLLLRDWLTRRFETRMRAVHKGFAAHGVSYLVSLRLMPIVPFGLCNILMGQTGIRTRTFYIVTQLCMLFATVIFVNAGSHIGGLHSLSGLMSWDMVIALAGLAALPWFGKLALIFLPHGAPARERQ